MNGGYKEDLKFIFNRDENPGVGMSCELKAGTYKEHLELIATELGLNPKYTSGISTAASMDNLSIVSENYRNVPVTAFVTAGIEVNGGRVGDKATYDELLDTGQVHAGTINIFLHLDANLSSGRLTRALVTCTEAKTAALQELMADSRYSNGLATGSGTDDTIIIGNLESDIQLTNVGKHSVFGEIIGRVVKKAVKEALFKQTELGPKMQQDIIRRARRFGVTEDFLWELYSTKYEIQKYQFMDRLHNIKTNKILVSLSSSYFHLMDELNWGLLDSETVWFSCKEILQSILDYYKTEFNLSSKEYINFDSLRDLYADVVISILESMKD